MRASEPNNIEILPPPIPPLHARTKILVDRTTIYRLRFAAIQESVQGSGGRRRLASGAGATGLRGRFGRGARLACQEAVPGHR